MSAATSVGDGTVESVAYALVSHRGRVEPLHVDRWFAEPTPAELRVLDRAVPPVLDVGCGPGRHTLALLARGVAAVGVDRSTLAVRLARARGASVLHRSIFDRLPGEGTWGSALLFDGSVGIGGRPVALLERLRRVLRSGGRVLVEVGPPGTTTESYLARLRGPSFGPWFQWASVGSDDLDAVAEQAGLRLEELWSGEGRWFGRLAA